MAFERFASFVRAFCSTDAHALDASGSTRRRALKAFFVALGATELVSRNPVATLAARDHPAGHLQKRKSQQRKRHRRKQRHRHHQRRNDSGSSRPNLKGISLLLTNPSTAKTTPRVICGELTPVYNQCNLLAVFDLAPGQPRVFDTSATHVYCDVKGQFWFEFSNPFLAQPWVTALVPETDTCPANGAAVISQRGLSEGETVQVAMKGQTFTIHRNDDKSDFKYFNFDLPATL